LKVCKKHRGIAIARGRKAATTMARMAVLATLRENQRKTIPTINQRAVPNQAQGSEPTCFRNKTQHIFRLRASIAALISSTVRQTNVR